MRSSATSSPASWVCEMAADLAEIDRGFVRIAEGQVHFREAGAHHGGRPLIMFHPSPTSSWILRPLMGRLGRDRHVIALDTLGNGDSCLPASTAVLDIAYFANAHLRALDALGVNDFDAYGSHTGGNIAAEVAIGEPGRVRALILDGMAVYSSEEQADMLAHYAPEIGVDHIGSQLNWAWHFVRDNALFWPWFRRDAAHVRKVGLPAPEVLHEKVIEVLKAVSSYHHSYRAAFAYDKRARLPLVKVRTLVASAEDDMLLEYLDAVMALMPDARRLVTPGSATPERAETTAAALIEFLDQS